MRRNRADVAIVGASAILAVLAIATPLIGIGGPIQLVAVFGAVILGPGSLAYRLATGSKWTECLTIGLALNCAAVMVIALLAEAFRLWHPKVELVIPAATCVAAVAFFRPSAAGRPPSPSKAGD